MQKQNSLGLKMIPVTYTEPAFRIREEKGKVLIFDTIRRTWIPLTEEEWVRQNFVQFLVQVLNYPSTLIAIEKEIILNDLKKRFDILIYDRNHKPWMLVECKAPSILLTESVLQQVLRYNMSVPVTFLIITNGSYTYGWEKVEADLQELNVMPPLL
jgi:hypothetical protein